MRPFDTTNAPVRLADAGAYAHLFELWSRSAHREILPTYQLGYLRARHTSRRRSPLPLLRLLVSPGKVNRLRRPADRVHRSGRRARPRARAHALGR